VAKFFGAPELLRSGIDLKLASTDSQADARSLQIFTLSPRYGWHRITLTSP
jgi:hypothetical protein